MTHSTLWKIFFAAILLAGVGYAVFFIAGRNRAKLDQPNFVAKRNEVATLLQQLSNIPDTDLTDLSVLESKRDWKSAQGLVSAAIEQNAGIVRIVEQLADKTRELTAETQRIPTASLREAALAAMVDLGTGNESMLLYFRGRSSIFRSLQQYYADLSLGKKLSSPDLDADLASLDVTMAKAKASYQSFQTRIVAFDHAAGLR